MKKQLLLLLAMWLPLVAMADASGRCGNNLTWIYTEATQTLTIEGSGAMSDYTSISNVPWYPYHNVIEKVIIGPNVTTIGSHAFERQSKVTYVYIHGTVTSVGDYAFSRCSGITSITIPNSVTYIGNYAFNECSGLTSVTIPNSVTYIGNYIFHNCRALTSVTISNNVTSIGEFAFQNCKALTSISIPNSVTSIKQYAFSGCSGLTSIFIGNSVSSIGEYAFNRCSALTSMEVDSDNTAIDSRENCNAIIFTKSNTLIAGCQNTIIPNSVTSIGNSAFENCTGLTSITIPSSVTNIGTAAFFQCLNLTSITIPSSVTSIGSNAFAYCTGLSTMRVDSDNTTYDSRDNCNAIIETNSNTLITGCQNTTIPNSVTSIGVRAFYGCSGLTSVTIPNSVTTIGNSAFTNCSGLTSITIPNSVTNIGQEAFYNCSGLNSIVIPNSVASIDQYAFAYCPSLTSIVIPSSVKSIDQYAFAYCSGLTILSIGEGVTSIGKSAFSNCNNMQDLYLYAEQPPTTEMDAFSSSNMANAKLHVPTNILFVYQSISLWKDFGTVVAIDGDPVVPEPQKCEKPTISYQNGKLTFASSTEGATCQYSIKDTDIKSGSGDEVQLTATYNISVYATKAGYDNSDVATATLCWIDVEPKTEGINNGIAQVPAKAVLIQAVGGAINVQGCDDGERIGVYSINGCQVGTSVSQNGTATINTTLQPGSVSIVKIGQKSVKVMMK